MSTEEVAGIVFIAWTVGLIIGAALGMHAWSCP